MYILTIAKKKKRDKKTPQKTNMREEYGIWEYYKDQLQIFVIF